MRQAQCANFEISGMARLLVVSRAGFYRWRRTQDGSPAITADLRDAGTHVSVSTHEVVFPLDMVDRKLDQGYLNAVWVAILPTSRTGRSQHFYARSGWFKP